VQTEILIQWKNKTIIIIKIKSWHCIQNI